MCRRYVQRDKMVYKSIFFRFKCIWHRAIVLYSAHCPSFSQMADAQNKNPQIARVEEMMRHLMCQETGKDIVQSSSAR